MAEFEIFYQTGSAEVRVRSAEDGSETIVALPEVYSGATKCVVLKPHSEAPSFRWNRLAA